jgi:hypothetical protein
MNKERDLLPWILGGLSAAAIAVAFAAVSTHRDVPTSPPQMIGAQLPALPTASPAPATAQTAAPAAEPDAVPVSAPPQAQTTAEPEVPSGQIWECTTKGVKTFSNNPCGEKSTLLDVGPINTMSPPPASHYPRTYGSEPRYATGYANQSTPADADEYADQYGAETGGDSYTVVQGVGLLARRRPQHFHPPPSSHNPAHNSGHNSGPVRRY